MASTTIDTPAGGVGKPALAPAMPAEKVSGRTWMAVAAGMLGAFMAVLDIQITNSSLKDILGTLSATQEEGSWIATAYLVAEIIVIPMTGLLTRVFGMRAYMMGTTALFLGFSTLCGFAWNLPSMIVFRMLQGFTGGALIPMAMTLVMTKLPPSKRATGMAIFGLTATLAPAMGPTFGGYLSELYGWPSIFYINWVPGVLLIGGIALGLDKEKFQPNLLFNADWLGIGFMALGLGSLTIFLEEGNSKDWFDSSFIITFAAMAIVGLLGWAVTGAMRKQPFVNLGLYGQRNFFAATALSLAMGMGLYGSSFLLPLYLGQIAGYSPMQIGEVIMWVGLPQLFIMPFVAKMSSKIDNRILCSFGLLLFGGSCLMNAYMDATTGYDQLLLSQVVRALGQPFVMLTLSNFAMNGISPKDMPSASSLINMTRNLGGSIGIALLATALTSREHFHSQRLGESVTGFAAATQERLAALTQSFMSKGFDATSASDMALKAVDGIVRREAYVMAYNDGFFLVAMVLFGCIGVLWFSDKVKAPSGGGGGAH
ncbi:DHA2 family efflux MFS transporter permease subunit [Rugamonas sp. FT82W]|uniref:DHA2 family efflux MFS transporter permease subunit n=1 Tax=Duganella vulcania TaxID=2692166 RepID=A0A845FZ48_9BURK|nr:DHA2 family efflux MFS transporter permease subunit [Duganella vulcania]MYM87763.1 DHA2 family efflux MFS transporter permease subunit [Duganella vulcania]